MNDTNQRQHEPKYHFQEVVKFGRRRRMTVFFFALLVLQGLEVVFGAHEEKAGEDEVDEGFTEGGDYAVDDRQVRHTHTDQSNRTQHKYNDNGVRLLIHHILYILLANFVIFCYVCGSFPDKLVTVLLLLDKCQF